MTEVAPRALLLAALLSGCARVVVPAGGPADTTAPVLLGSIPDSGATRVGRQGPFRMRFSEWVDPATVKASVSLAPAGARAPDIKVDGPEVVIVPREPLDSPATYVLRILPGLSDWHKAATKVPQEIPFATGDRIDSGRILVRMWIGSDTAPPVPVRGRLGAWPRDSGVRKGLSRLLRRKDSTAWLNQPPRPEREKPWRWAWADSTGLADLRFLPPGEWTIAGWNDKDKDNFWRPAEEPVAWAGVVRHGSSVWTDSFPLRLELHDTGLAKPDTTHDSARDSLHLRDSLALDSIALRWDRLPEDSTGWAWLGADSLPPSWKGAPVRVRVWPVFRRARARLSASGKPVLRLPPGKWAGEAWIDRTGSPRPTGGGREGSPVADPWCPVPPFEIDRGDSLRIHLDCAIRRTPPDSGKVLR